MFKTLPQKHVLDMQKLYIDNNKNYMKKIVLTLALSAFAFAANAQLVISANIGGSQTSGEVSTSSEIVVGTDSTTPPQITPLEGNTNLTGGLKIGYKFGKAEVGIAASYNKSTSKNMPLDPTIIPIIGIYEGVNYGIPTIKTTGGISSSAVTSITIAPYFRYDILRAGDVAIFAELNLFYNMTKDPTIVFTELNEGPEGIALPSVKDTTIVRPLNSTSLGVSVVPGLSWQLNDNCSIDLYLDFLSLAYRKTTTNRIDFAYNSRIVNGNKLVTDHTETVITTTQTAFGGTLTGTPLLTELHKNNWVRVGFNFTF